MIGGHKHEATGLNLVDTLLTQVIGGVARELRTHNPRAWSDIATSVDP